MSAKVENAIKSKVSQEEIQNLLRELSGEADAAIDDDSATLQQFNPLKVCNP